MGGCHWSKTGAPGSIPSPDQWRQSSHVLVACPSTPQRRIVSCLYVHATLHTLPSLVVYMRHALSCLFLNAKMCFFSSRGSLKELPVDHLRGDVDPPSRLPSSDITSGRLRYVLTRLVMADERQSLGGMHVVLHWWFLFPRRRSVPFGRSLTLLHTRVVEEVAVCNINFCVQRSL